MTEAIGGDADGIPPAPEVRRFTMHKDARWIRVRSTTGRQTFGEDRGEGWYYLRRREKERHLQLMDHLSSLFREQHWATDLMGGGTGSPFVPHPE